MIHAINPILPPIAISISEKNATKSPQLYLTALPLSRSRNEVPKVYFVWLSMKARHCLLIIVLWFVALISGELTRCTNCFEQFV